MKEEIETRNVAEMAQSENRQAGKNVAVTPAMIEAGVGALLKNFRYEQGRLPPVELVYRAMEAVRPKPSALGDPKG